MTRTSPGTGSTERGGGRPDRIENLETDPIEAVEVRPEDSSSGNHDVNPGGRE
jgi:hypothetical protein